jgi:hypothetical protein
VKALGLTAMIIAIVSIFIPVMGVYLTFVTAALAAFAAGEGFVFGAVAIGLNAISLLFLSPMLWVADAAQKATGTNEGSAAALGAFLVISQIVAFVILFRKNKKLQAVVAE